LSAKLEKYYNGLAQDYDTVRFRKPYHRRVDLLERRFVLSAIPPGAEIVEVGGGTGRFSSELLKVASSLTVVDASAEMLSVIKSKLGESTALRLIKGDVNELDALLGKECCEIVVSMRLLPHLEGKREALSGLNRVLRPGGAAIFDFWNGRSFVGWGRTLLKRRLESPVFYVDYKTARMLIEEAGFRIVDSFAWGYPRIGRFSLDVLGNRIAKSLGYSILFHVKKV
jgi:ubiquinone/menaquinone biosynthesis C-methylase UbiE